MFGCILRRQYGREWTIQRLSLPSPLGTCSVNSYADPRASAARASAEASSRRRLVDEDFSLLEPAPIAQQLLSRGDDSRSSQKLRIRTEQIII